MSEVGVNTWMIAVLVPAMLLASWSDCRAYRVPNWLTGGLAASGLAAQCCIAGGSGLWFGLLGLLTGFSLLVGLWLIGAMGAGDVKFMAGLGAWLGPQMTLFAVLTGGVIGGVLALALIARRGRLRQSLFNVGLLAGSCSSLRTAWQNTGPTATASRASSAMPYAVPLTIGTLLVLAAKHSGWWGIL